MSPKITFIGGGSYQWGPKLLLDIANTPSLQHAEIVLQDIDPTPLPKMLAFLEHVVATRKIGWRCSATTDQRAALDLLRRMFAQHAANQAGRPGAIPRVLVAWWKGDFQRLYPRGDFDAVLAALITRGDVSITNGIFASTSSGLDARESL